MVSSPCSTVPGTRLHDSSDGPVPHVDGRHLVAGRQCQADGQLADQAEADDTYPPAWADVGQPKAMQGDGADRGERGVGVVHTVGDRHSRRPGNHLVLGMAGARRWRPVARDGSFDGLTDLDRDAGGRVPERHLLVEPVLYRSQRGVGSVGAGPPHDLPHQIGPARALPNRLAPASLPNRPLGPCRQEAPARG